MSLRHFDLNLLKVFATIMRERQLTRTGQQLGLTQSAVSQALKRLRETLDDDLFVRTGTEMRPTPLALELEPTVLRILADAEQCLHRSGFDPASSERTFSLMLGELHAGVLVPRLLEVLRDQAPRARLKTRALARPDTVREMQNHTVDLALLAGPEPPPSCEHLRIGEAHYVVAMDRTHPLADAPLTMDAYLEAEHVGLNLTSAEDDVLAHVVQPLSRSRNVVVNVNYVGNLSAILRASGALATLPVGMATQTLDAQTFVLRRPPWEPPPSPLWMLWTQMVDRDPASRWIRAQVGQLFREYLVQTEVSLRERLGNECGAKMMNPTHHPT